MVLIPACPVISTPSVASTAASHFPVLLVAHVVPAKAPVATWLLQRLPVLAMVEPSVGSATSTGAAYGGGGGAAAACTGGVPGLILSQLRWWVQRNTERGNVGRSSCGEGMRWNEAGVSKSRVLPRGCCVAPAPGGRDGPHTGRSAPDLSVYVCAARVCFAVRSARGGVPPLGRPLWPASLVSNPRLPTCRLEVVPDYGAGGGESEGGSPLVDVVLEVLPLTPPGLQRQFIGLLPELATLEDHEVGLGGWGPGAGGRAGVVVGAGGRG